MFTAIIGMFFAILNGFPIRTRVVANDAYNIMLMLKDINSRRAFWRIMKINALGVKQKKLLDMPKELFSDLTEDNYGNPLICGFAVDLIYYYLERQDYKKALHICNQIIEEKRALKTYKNEAFCEKQFCEIMLGVEINEITVCFLKNKVLKERIELLMSYHTLYAFYRFVLHDNNKTLQILNDFEHKCQNNCNKGIVAHERYIFKLLNSI